MTKPKTFIAVLCALALGALLTGCITGSQNRNSIPWSQPATWENQVPGMGSSTQPR